MAGRPPGGGRKGFSDEDSRLDQLAISATSASNQAASSDTIAKTAEEEERSSSRRKIRMCIWAACIIFGLGVLVTGARLYGRYAERKEQERIAAEAQVAREKEQARLDALAASTREKVAGHLTRFEFSVAAREVADAMKDGLAPAVSEELEDSIQLAGRTRWSELVAQAGAELDEGHLESARTLMASIALLNAYADDGEKESELYERMRVIAREKELEPSRVLMRQCREALAEQEWAEALRLLDTAREGLHEPSEVRTLAETVEETIGGRLVVTLDPADATFRIGDGEPHKSLEPLVGLKDGMIKLVIRKEGYVPRRVQVHVQYPTVTEVEFGLRPEAPERIWGLRVLQGSCAQALAGEYYSRKLEGEAWLDVLPKIVQPCVASAPVDGADRRRLTKKRRVELVDEAVAAFREDVKKHPIEAMNNLAVFRTQYPEFTRGVLRQCGKRIGTCLEPLGRACCDCWGRGHVPCRGCDGTGERREDRECPDCEGKGTKVHTECNGTGSLECPRCGGTGMAEKQVIEDGRAVVRRVPCTKCDGSGKVRCDACRGTGKISCLRCRGTGRAKIVGPCSECQGKGHHSCESCDGTGSRDDMDIDRRGQVEEELRYLLELLGG